MSDTCTIPSKISLILLSSAATIMTVIGPVGPMTTTAYIPFTLITSVPKPVALGSLEHITITVSGDGPNGTRIPGTTICGMVIPPSSITANTEHTFSGLRFCKTLT